MILLPHHGSTGLKKHLFCIMIRCHLVEMIQQGANYFNSLDVLSHSDNHFNVLIQKGAIKR